MKRNRLMVAGTGLAAAGLALFASFTVLDGNGSKYRPSAVVKPNSEHDLESHGAAGAALWRFNRMQDGNGNLNLDEMLRIQQLSSASYTAQRNSNASVTAVGWNELGPDNVGGRTRALLIDRNNSQHMFAGGVSGGLWESTDGANNWSKCAGFFNIPEVNINVASIAQGSDGAIYVGTGEGLYGDNTFNVSGSGAGGFLGGGMYKSTDGGATFALLIATKPLISNSATSVWAAINKIAVNPNNPQMVVVATNRGIRISTDGGQTWTTPIGSLGTLGSTDVDFGSDGSLIVCVGGRPYRSTDNGATFTNLGNSPGFATVGLSRVEIGIAAQDPNWIYAFCAGSTGNLAGAFLSIDGGASWNTIAGTSSASFDPFGTGGQGFYDNACEVDPNDKNRCIFGGVQLWKWENAVSNPSNQSPPAGQWTRAALEFPNSIFNPYYVHADKHAVVFHPTQPNTFFIATDGGVFRTIDGGTYYTAMNKGYNTTQFYGLAHDHSATNRNIAVGGLQDNGTQYIDGLGNTPMSSTLVNVGDGGHTEMSFLNQQAIFSTIYFGALYRSDNNGGGSSTFYTERVTSEPGFGQDFWAGFVTPTRLWETLNNPQSVDSVVLTNNLYTQLANVGNGVEDSLIYTISQSSVFPTSVPSPSLDLSSIIVTAGTDTAFSNGSGVFSGDGTGLVTSTGNISLRFNVTPANNTIIRVFYGVRYNAGSILYISSNQAPGRTYEWITPSAILPNDVVRIQDPINARIVVGSNIAPPTFDGGVYMTKGPLVFSTNPEWIKIGGRRSVPSAMTGMVSTMTWSNDGNHLYVGTEEGNLYRISNINAVIDSANGDVEFGAVVNPNCVVTCTRIAAFPGRNICAIDVHPADNGRVVIALGNYSQTQYVFYSSTADTDPAVTNAGTFVNKTGNMITPTTGLGAAPAYSVSFDKYNLNRVLVGTERGVIETQNITAGTVSWAWALTGLNDNVGVDMIRQQRWDPWHVPNAGCFYIGTHGRGIWRDDSSWQQPVVGINQPGAGASAGATVNKDLRVFPNPVIDDARVAFRLTKSGDAVVQIYDLNGRVVLSEQHNNLAVGQQNVKFNAAELAKGTYLIVVTQDNDRIGTGRFVKTN
jgi:Secretion system C-terminal sorting domain